MTRRLVIPAGMLDSNVVLDAGNGNRAVGRCTLDLVTGLGLCTFSDGPRKARRVPCPCRCRLHVGMPLGRDVRLRGSW